ncbi:MAG: restriction endonuclease subunit S [Gemmataceae bacterium]|nr:restriction endonuclease subunit S [Gemmataceae bacterium]MCI0739443.1 restriction endonuclease subunit S [Gemmataceae bacterium]
MNNVAVDGSLNWSAIRRVPSSHGRAQKYRLAPGDVVFNHTNSPELVGKTALFTGFKEPVLYSNHFLRLRVDESKLHPRYLALWLNFQWKHRVFERLCTQWVNQATVRRDDLLDLSIELPDLADQKRIAAILERADRLRRLRRYGLEMARAFTPAVFNEVFGDPISNAKKYDRSKLSAICTNITDGTHDTPERVSAGVPFITSKNIRPFEIDLTDLEFVTPEVHREIIKRCNPQFGDVLYTNIGVNVGNAVANCLPFEFSLKNVALIQPNRGKLEPRFIESLLNHIRFKESILNVSSVAGAQKFVSLDVLRGVEIIVPPLPLQKRFALIADRHERSEKVHREALRQGEHVFQTLLHRAFTEGV